MSDKGIYRMKCTRLKSKVRNDWRAIAVDIQQSLVQTSVFPERKCCMTDRIRFITHQGKQILLIDFSNCAASDVGKICREVPDFVTTLPRGSALLLSDFTGASFDGEAMRDMKQAAVFDKSHVRKSAWVGAENFPKVFSEGLRTFSRREFPAFKTREEAL